MEHWLLLILLSIITLFIVKRNTQITKTPVWLLWLVMMTPAFIWTAWSMVMGEDQPIPLIIVITPFVFCPILYGWLIQRGRLKPEQKPPIDSPIDSPMEMSESPKPEDSPQLQEQLSQVKPIDKSEEKALRNCFPWGVYYLQHIDYHPQAILCRGKLRAVPEEAYKIIKKNIEKSFGDRFLVVFQESFMGQPFFALVPNIGSQENKTEIIDPLIRPRLALGLLFITLFTTTWMGVQMNGVASEQLQADPQLLIQGLPYSLALVAILGIHELSHYLTAIYYKIKTTLPYFIPVPFFLGTFGAYIQMRSPVPNRKALFDVALAGPVGGFIITLPILLWGLSQSQVVPLPENPSLLNFDGINPRLSFLLAVLSKLVLGEQLAPGMGIDLHLAAIAGYIGLLITALNLMPIGQLDGGHIVHAMFGQTKAAIIGQVARLLMFVLAIAQPAFLLWAVILLFMPIADQPALNDVSELDNLRDFLGLLSLTILIIILLPVPGTIAQLWNI